LQKKTFLCSVCEAHALPIELQPLRDTMTCLTWTMELPSLNLASVTSEKRATQPPPKVHESGMRERGRFYAVLTRVSVCRIPRARSRNAAGAPAERGSRMRLSALAHRCWGGSSVLRPAPSSSVRLCVATRARGLEAQSEHLRSACGSFLTRAPPCRLPSARSQNAVGAPSSHVRSCAPSRARGLETQSERLRSAGAVHALECSPLTHTRQAGHDDGTISFRKPVFPLPLLRPHPCASVSHPEREVSKRSRSAVLARAPLCRIPSARSRNAAGARLRSEGAAR